MYEMFEWNMLMATLEYPFLHSKDGCKIGSWNAAKPMSHTLGQARGPRSDITVSKHGYHLDVWKLSATPCTVRATSRIPHSLFGPALSLEHLIKTLEP